MNLSGVSGRLSEAPGQEVGRGHRKGATPAESTLLSRLHCAHAGPAPPGASGKQEGTASEQSDPPEELSTPRAPRSSEARHPDALRAGWRSPRGATDVCGGGHGMNWNGQCWAEGGMQRERLPHHVHHGPQAMPASGQMPIVWGT